MKVLITRNPTHIQDAIPEFEAEFPSLAFTFCESHEEGAGMVSDVDIYIGWINREIFLAAKKTELVDLRRLTAEREEQERTRRIEM
jgi:hypothetical protein